MTEAGSLQDRLRKRRALWTDEDAAVPVPGYGGELVARYKDTSWSTFRAVTGNSAMTALGNEVPVEQELNAAIDMLLEANTGMEARVDGKVAEIPDVKMGLTLAAFLGEDMASVDTDRQAMYLIFHRQKDIMSHAIALVQTQEGRADEANGSIAKN